MKLRTSTLTRICAALLRSGRRPTNVTSSAFETLTRAGLLTPEEDSILARVDPLVEVMFLMMAADGSVADAERDALRGAVRALSGGTIHSGTISVLLDLYQQRLAAEGREARLQAVAELLADEPTEAEVGFTLAAAVALADDEVAPEENEFINQLASWFGIDEIHASRILDRLEEDTDEDEPLS